LKDWALVKTSSSPKFNLPRKKSIKTRASGSLLYIDTASVGTLKVIGGIYQMSAIDTSSNYAWVKLYTSKSAFCDFDFLLHIRNHAHTQKISRILTDNGLEFTTHHKSKNHKFGDL